MKKKFAIVLALFLIAVVCSAGCIDPEDPVDPIDPVDPVDPVDPITPVDPVVPEEPEKPVDPVVPEKGDFTVTFMMNSAVDNSVYLTKYVDEGKAVTEPAAPEKPKENYVFVKWTTDKENRHAYDFTTPVTADLVLYADWDVKGTSSGSGHSHNWGAGVVTTDPTCGAEGVMTYTCNCGQTKTESIPATGQHPSLKLSEGKIVCAVCDTPLIAQIDTNYYASFANAMQKAVSEDRITLLAAVTNGDVTKNVVIDTNKTATSLKYSAVLKVVDIKINQSNSDNLGTVMLGDEEVFFEVDDSNNKLADSNGNLIVAYTKKGSTYTVYTNYGLKKALLSTSENVVIVIVGQLTYDWGGDSYANSKALLMKDKTISGFDEIASITFAGYGSANPITDVTLTNIIVHDQTIGDDEGAWEHGYLEFTNLTAANVIFKDSILLNGQSELTACTFNNAVNSWYSLWINSGDVKLNRCIFTGTRAVKIHEAYGSDVASVIVDGCTFGPLSEKPGIVIGDLNGGTSVTIKNSAFNDCQAGDQNLYIYETDTDVSSFTFVNDDNSVQNTPSP